LCGIVGFTHRLRVPSPDRIQSALDSLIHRGPDRQAAFRSNFVSLGATRLKIIDLEGGDQPMVSASGDTVIAFNGEIYNHEELRRELEQKGHHFRSHADTETVLEAFLEWDTECFSRLRGMFAVALWTESEKRLVLARDRVGIKPLYLTRRGGDLYFASELKAILVHPEIDRRIGLDGLDCYLAVNYVPGTHTLIDGIEKLEPGRWLEWRDGATRSASYWELPFSTPGNWTLDTAKQQLDALLQLSVKEHLLSDVPLGIWLSGGVDSTTILHYAATASPSQLKTFSISFKGRSFDESSYIRQAVAAYGTDHHELDLTPEADLEGAIQEFGYYADEPNADAGALPVWFLSKMTKDHATVALSGEGADELFGGYLTYRADHLARIARRAPAAALNLALQAVRRWPVSDEKISLEYKLKRFLEGCQMSPPRAHVFWNGTFSDAERQALLRTPGRGWFDGLLNTPKSAGDNLASHLWFDQRNYLPEDILAKVDRISMAHSIEVRPPFLDHRIVQFAASLPDHLKIAGSRQKLVLKELMKGKLPPQILQRKKIGFDIPAHEWLRGPLRKLMTDTLGDVGAEYGGLFRQKEIDRLVAQHLARRANVGYHLWGLMILFLWMRKWRIQTAAALPMDRQFAKSVSTI
jgi:asparagine synthase (glutamine-hydrolysing)